MLDSPPPRAGPGSLAPILPRGKKRRLFGPPSAIGRSSPIATVACTDSRTRRELSNRLGIRLCFTQLPDLFLTTSCLEVQASRIGISLLRRTGPCLRAAKLF